jgi:putative oxidoreductase
MMDRLFHWHGHAWLSLPARFYLAYVFIYACLHKIAHPGSFALDVATYDILPLYLVNIMAIILPWMELAAGILLVVGFRTRAAALIITGMMVMFVVAILIALGKGLDMSCGCFASQSAAEDDPISFMTVLRDAGWLALSVYVFLFDRNAIGVDRMLNRRRNAHA